MRKVEKPSLRNEARGKGETHEVYSHPAYGTISMHVVTGGDPHMFGSDIKHGQRIRLEVRRAEHHRNLSNDWYHTIGRALIEVELSHSQFAEFITTPNRGEGIPCTITEIAGAMMPAIDQVESKAEMFRREIEASAERRLTAIAEKIDQLGAMIDSGKLPKGELRALHNELARHVVQLPGSIGFVVEQGEEALEKAATAAKIQIEATISSHINRIGLDAARAIGLVQPDTNIKEIEL